MCALVRCALPLLLLAASGARVYDRCELARDFLRHGLPHRQLATWLCIAYHESRFDTAAVNAQSGDYGVLQISQLYWCGDTGPNVCGVPCERFVDDDIADDVRCALRVYSDHDALQGDGFKAWVAYASCGEHHVKKYLADCGDVRKNITTTPRPKAARIASAFNATYYRNIDSLMLPSFGKQALTDQLGREPKRLPIVPGLPDHFKVKIDALKLPVFNNTFRFTTKPPLSLSTEVTSRRVTDKPTTEKIRDISKTERTTERIWSTSKMATARKYPTERVTERPLPVTRPAVSQTTMQVLVKKTQSPEKNTFTTRYPMLTWTRKPLQARNSSNTAKATSTAFPHSPKSTPTTTTQRPPSSTTESIFALYLNTRRPSPATFSFAPLTGKRYRVQIFSGGTTTAYTPLLKSRNSALPKITSEKDDLKYNHWRDEYSSEHNF